MMKKLQILCLSLLGFHAPYAQNISFEFGKISQYEMDYSVCDFDSTAEAVVIYDIGKSSFVESENGYDIRFIRKKRIKILSEAGLDYAQVEIPFYHEGYKYEMVSNIQAISYNVDNGIPRTTVLEKGDWHDEKVTENWDVRKFAIPDVKTGSVIEFTYELSTPYFFNLPDWEFQGSIPVIYSHYEARLIPFYEYVFLLKGTNKFDEYKSFEDRGFDRHYGSISFRDMVYVFGMRNVPAFKEEELIASKNDYLLKLDFQLSRIKYPTGGTAEIVSTWPKIIKDLEDHEDFGRFIKKSDKSADDLMNVDELAQKPPMERFNTVLNYVKHNYNWNKWNAAYASKSVKDLVQDKYGNAAELNLFAIGLLRANGIEAYPVWISTRNHGKIAYNYPFTHFFNYVLIHAKVDGIDILSDATEVLLANDRIPERCINDKGLIINPDEKEVKWALLESTSPSKENLQFKLKIEDYRIKGNIQQLTTDYDAFDNRKTYGNNVEALTERLNKRGYEVSDTSIKIKNYDTFEKPYMLSYNFDVQAEVINSKIYVSPFLNEVNFKNPLTQKTRNYPVDFTFPKVRSYNTYITVPEGYSVEYIPRKFTVSNELFDMNYVAMLNDGNIVVSLNYYFKKSVYYPENYLKIKSYFDRIIEKGNDKIVFTKIQVLTQSQNE